MCLFGRLRRFQYHVLDMQRDYDPFAVQISQRIDSLEYVNSVVCIGANLRVQ